MAVGAGVRLLAAARRIGDRMSFTKVLLTTAAIMVLAPAAHADLTTLTLEQVYAMPMEKLEEEVYAQEREQCEALLSATDGEADPNGLTKAERCVVQNYTNSSFETINKSLALAEDASGLNGAQWGFVRVMDAALKKIKSQARTVYSGTHQRHVKFADMPKGKTIRFKPYTSTSTLQEKAEDFMTDRMMIIKIANGKNLAAYSNAGMESEILLPRSTKLRFDDRKVKLMEVWTEEGPVRRKVELIYLTEVP